MPDGKDAAAAAAKDLEVLFPDVDVDVRDPDGGGAVTVTVSEFRMLDGLRAQAEARSLIAALGAAVDAASAADAAEEVTSAAALDAVIGEHADEWLALLARATGHGTEWLGRLGDRDGRAVAEAMWQANGPFFVRRIVAELLEPESVLRSLASSRTSSPPATDATSGTSQDASPSAR